MELSEMIRPEHINLELVSKGKNDALDELAGLFEKTGVLEDKASFLNDVLERELISGTGIGNGVAIPHGKSKFVKETSVAIGIAKNGLEWETFDGDPVRFVVLLAVNVDDKTGKHVRLLSQLARKLASEKICKRLRIAGSIDEIVQILSE